MAHSDQQYIADLVKMAQTGNSDAFAELYMATHQKVFHFAFSYLENKDIAKEALKEIYILALQQLLTLKDQGLFVSWLDQLTFRICFRIKEQITNEGKDSVLDPEKHLVTIHKTEYVIREIFGLPSTESQILILHYYNHLKIKDIADMLEISNRTARRYLKSGLSKLQNHSDQRGV